jgi:UDP-N-acetylmuramyl tripeptide synthase
VTLLAPKLAAARAVGALARASGRGGGTSLPGKVLMRLEPGAISELAARLGEGNVVLSATNGKTTTAAMISSVLERRGRRLVHNRAGANMAGGVASALAAAARRGGRELDGDLGLFEVDEFWLAQLVGELRPRALLLSNLFRDQLDRYGELETIAERWAEVVAGLPAATRLVLNADDPLVADLGRDTPGALFFGVDDDSLARPELQHASDSKHCRRCGAPYVYEAIYLGHLGHYRCPNCHAERPAPSVRATAVELRGIRSAAFTLEADGQSARVELPLPGLYNVYNALAAAALCLALDVPFAEIVSGLASVEPAFGRAETIPLAGREASLLLIKNPAGANEVLRTLMLEGGELDLLGILNDRIADGRDVSWVWDADWELVAPHVGRMVCAGTRAAELAVRLKYAGVDPARLEVVDALPAALDRALQNGTGPLYVLPTYTALIELRELLTARGDAQEYWR